MLFRSSLGSWVFHSGNTLKTDWNWSHRLPSGISCGGRFSCWHDHRLDAGTIGPKPKHDLNPQLWAGMIDSLRMSHQRQCSHSECKAVVAKDSPRWTNAVGTVRQQPKPEQFCARLMVARHLNWIIWCREVAAHPSTQGALLIYLSGSLNFFYFACCFVIVNLSKVDESPLKNYLELIGITLITLTDVVSSYKTACPCQKYNTTKSPISEILAKQHHNTICELRGSHRYRNWLEGGVGSTYSLTN